MKEVLLAELDSWSFPVSDWELETVSEIVRFPSMTVQRAPASQLEWMRMKPRQCHANARFMEQNDPEKRTKQIIGWWPQGSNFVLHSIVYTRGNFVCVTPVDNKMIPDEQFTFIPDPKIEVRDDGKVRTCYRDGVKIGPGVRRDPAQALADIKIIRERLLSGMDPYEAVKLP